MEKSLPGVGKLTGRVLQVRDGGPQLVNGGTRERVQGIISRAGDGYLRWRIVGRYPERGLPGGPLRVGYGEGNSVANRRAGAGRKSVRGIRLGARRAIAEIPQVSQRLAFRVRRSAAGELNAERGRPVLLIESGHRRGGAVSTGVGYFTDFARKIDVIQPRLGGVRGHAHHHRPGADEIPHRRGLVAGIHRQAANPAPDIITKKIGVLVARRKVGKRIKHAAH